MPPARPPSRRAACNPTTRPFICCSVAFIWRRATRHRRSRNCAGPCGSIRCSRPRTASSGSVWWRWAALPKPSPAGTNGIGSRGAVPRKSRSARMWSARGRPRGYSSMAEDIRALSAQLAQDPQSLVFLRLGEALRRKGQLDASLRVAMNGLERHPHLADAHDLYARILTDTRDYERAFDEWDTAVRIAPHHTGALKGLAFLYFKVGDIDQAEAHLAAANRVAPDGPNTEQALAILRKGLGPPSPTPGPVVEPTATAASSTAAVSSGAL